MILLIMFKKISHNISLWRCNKTLLKKNKELKKQNARLKEALERYNPLHIYQVSNGSINHEQFVFALQGYLGTIISKNDNLLKYIYYYLRTYFNNLESKNAKIEPKDYPLLISNFMSYLGKDSEDIAKLELDYIQKITQYKIENEQRLKTKN